MSSHISHLTFSFTTGLSAPVLVRLDAERRISPDLSLTFLTARVDEKVCLVSLCVCFLLRLFALVPVCVCVSACALCVFMRLRMYEVACLICQPLSTLPPSTDGSTAVPGA